MKPLVTLLVLALVVAPSCSKKPVTDEAEKLIRAADAEITSIARRFLKTHGLKALSQVYRIKGVDALKVLPAANVLSLTSDQAQGIPLDVSPDTTADGHILITFPYRFKSDSLATFRLLAYETQSSLLTTDFPTKYTCNITTTSGVRLLDIRYEAQMKYGLPENMKLELKSGGFDVRANLKTSFRKKNSTLRANFTVSENGKEKMSARMHSLVELAPDSSIRFGRKNITCKVFPILVDVRATRGLHTYDPLNFVRDFNADHQILIFDHDKHLLGHVRLVEKPGKDYINPVATLNNQVELEVENLMQSVRQLLRMKLGNPYGI